MVKILVVRHGFSQSNLDGTFTGHIDAPLTDLGLKQGKLVSDYIYKNYKIDAIYSSDLSRAVSTIKPLADNLNMPIKTDKNLREIYGGVWEGKTIAKIKELYSSDYEKWHGYAEDMCPTEGESMREVMQRSKNALLNIARENQGKTVVVATHGGLIKALQGELMGLSVSQLKTFDYVCNASIMEIEYDGEFKIVNGCISHYLGELLTEMTKGV